MALDKKISGSASDPEALDPNPDGIDTKIQSIGPWTTPHPPKI